jgi:hypothetical protein
MPNNKTLDTARQEDESDRLLRTLGRIQRQNASGNGLLLHFDAEVNDLRCWLWYVAIFRPQSVNSYSRKARP